VAEEVGDQLQESGMVTIAELAKNYDLPGEFISEVACTELLRLFLHSILQLVFIVECLAYYIYRRWHSRRREYGIQSRLSVCLSVCLCFCPCSKRKTA